VPFPRELLTDDEVLVLDLRPHWWYIAPPSVYLGIAVLVGLVALLNDWPSAVKVLIGLVVLVALGYFAKRYSAWATTNFVVTNERVVSRSGVVAKKGIEIPLDRINTVFFNQSFFERLLGAGDLGIESAGESGRQTFSDIRKPNLVQQEIYRQKEAFERNRYADMGRSIASQIPGQNAAAAPPPPQVNVPEQIEHLDRLRRSGAITEEEFQAKKAELLRRM
jgi:membrane protein YdbS with pleckstrin-like domain